MIDVKKRLEETRQAIEMISSSGTAIPEEAIEIEEVFARCLAAETILATYRHALDESVKLQSHYADLLNGYDGGTRIRFASASEWLTRPEVCESDRVESYIKSLKWSDDATDMQKTLVAGNIRAFASHIRDMRV